MRQIIPVTAAVLLLVSCSNGADTNVSRSNAAAGRDLNLGASQPASEPLVLSAVERQSMPRPASKGRGKVRLAEEVKTAVPRNEGRETVAVTNELTPAAATEVLPDAPAGPPVEMPVAAAGAGHSLAPGQTVSSIPAVSMGSGDPPAIQTIATRGTGMGTIRIDDNCAPHRGATVAINRVYDPGQGGFRRF
jgi:hypothetical protein